MTAPCSSYSTTWPSGESIASRFARGPYVQKEGVAALVEVVVVELDAEEGDRAHDAAGPGAELDRLRSQRHTLAARHLLVASGCNTHSASCSPSPPGTAPVERRALVARFE
jgi:hypothetical protein